MSVVNYVCKICKRPGTVTLRPEDEGERHWREALATLLVCNSCYDKRQEYQKAVRGICVCCWRLLGARGRKKKMSEDWMNRLHEELRQATKHYAGVMQEFWKSTEFFWEENFVEMFWDQPDKVGLILKSYRTNFEHWRRTLPANQPNLPHSAD